jgi:hypothetical protein
LPSKGKQFQYRAAKDDQKDDGVQPYASKSKLTRAFNIKICFSLTNGRFDTVEGA